MVRPTLKTTTVTMILAREPLPKTTAIQLFKSLFLARRSEEYIVKHYPENQMRTPMHMSMGQEFVPVGVCAGLDGKADVFASYRSHAAFLAQTHDTDRFFSELYGRTSGTGEGKGGSMHLAAPDQGHMLSSGVVATQIPVAVGAAFANLRLGTGRTAVAFFGDGAADAGVFWESINSAALFRPSSLSAPTRTRTTAAMSRAFIPWRRKRLRRPTATVARHSSTSSAADTSSMSASARTGTGDIATRRPSSATGSVAMP